MSHPIRVAPYTDEWVEAVRAFNQRVAASGFQFPDTPRPGWGPNLELFVALEGDAVRGGYILRHQRYHAAGADYDVAHYRLPLSEGSVNREYAMLGPRLIRDALSRQKRLYAMGMGGRSRPLPQILKALGWRVCEAPFFFKVLRPARFLRNLRALRTSALRRFAMDVAALTGAATIGAKVVGHGRRLAPEPHDTLPSFAGWADEVWRRSRSCYPMLLERDAAALDASFPPEDPRFLRVRTGAGWSLLLDTQMQDHKQFGNMRVGTIVDCLAPPAEAGAVTRAATAVLEARGVDLIVSNQLHRDWSRALAECGFRQGPSNYLLACSPALAALAGDAPDDAIHFNRGDGDGAMHL